VVVDGIVLIVEHLKEMVAEYLEAFEHLKNTNSKIRRRKKLYLDLQ
jgi:hypothetical protein